MRSVNLLESRERRFIKANNNNNKLHITQNNYGTFSMFSPWHNRTGWLGVKHQLTYLLTYFGPKYAFPSGPL